MSKPGINITIGSGGTSTLLFLLFLALKLTGHIDWSWWWVTCPLWVVPAVVGAFGIGALVVLAVIFLVALAFERWG